MQLNIPRFLCDEMLAQLAHWLRAAGYDTALAKAGDADRFLFEKAKSESRLLLTRDRKFVEYKLAKEFVLFLDCNSTRDCANALSKQVAITWDFHPFSRCLVCNTLLIPATEQQMKRIPPGSSQHTHIAYYCPICDKVYWEGSHVKRLRNTLAELNNACGNE